MARKIFRRIPLMLAVFGVAFALALAGCGGTNNPTDVNNGNYDDDDDNGNDDDNGEPITPSTFIVSFISASGTLVPEQEVEEGGLVTEPATEMTMPWVPNVHGTGLWLIPSMEYAFGGWRHGSETEPWNFAADPVTGDMTLTAIWTEPVPELVDTVDETDVAASVIYVNNADSGIFILAIDDDLETGGMVLHANGADLSIISLYGISTISIEGDQRLFTVGPESGTGNASLTLWNIILQGHTAGMSSDFVWVRNGGRLYMEGASSITGHHSNATAITNGRGAAVLVSGGGILTMRGGDIIENWAIGDADPYRAGGVAVSGAGSRLVVEGGRLMGNWRLAMFPSSSDVLLYSDTDPDLYYELTENASVGDVVRMTEN